MDSDICRCSSGKIAPPREASGRGIGGEDVEVVEEAEVVEEHDGRGGRGEGEEDDENDVFSN